MKIRVPHWMYKLSLMIALFIGNRAIAAGSLPVKNTQWHNQLWVQELMVMALFTSFLILLSLEEKQHRQQNQ